jgi:hypothetical protein
MYADKGVFHLRTSASSADGFFEQLPATPALSNILPSTAAAKTRAEPAGVTPALLSSLLFVDHRIASAVCF